MTATFWEDFRRLMAQPLFVEGLAVVVIFVLFLLFLRRIQGIAAELERRRALADYVRGLDEFLRGEYRAAIGTLEAVLERDPENVEARIALGDCYRETGDAAEGKKHHHHVHKVFGHELARNFLSLGRDELALKNYDRAVESFSRCLELSPDEAEALEGLARANAEGGNPVAAAEALRRLYPEGPGADLGRTARREAAGRFADAGFAAAQEGQAEQAISFFTEALAFQPENMRARTGLLRAANMLGDQTRARALVEEHLGKLRQLSADESVLFEPAGARPLAADAALGGEVPSEAGSPFLPAKIEEVGTVVAAVEGKTARYSCGACGALTKSYASSCTTCGAVGTIEALPQLAALYTMPLPGFREAVDEVEENVAFLQSLAQKAALGDGAALQGLVDRGPRVLFGVFAALAGIEARRWLGERLAAMGPLAAQEVASCRGAAARGLFSGEVMPQDEFAAGFFLALSDAEGDRYFEGFGPALDGALAGALADPRLSPAVRDAAQRRLGRRGLAALVPMVEAVAASGDPSSVERASALVHDFGREAVETLERRYFTATLMGKLFGPRGTRRKTVADLLARCRLPEAVAALSRAAASETDPALKSHYAAARERAEREAKA